MIPATVHFAWIGSDLPWAYALAVRSAALRGEVDAAILHHTDELLDAAPVRALRATPGVELKRLEPSALFESATSFGGVLSDLYARVPSPVSRSNILRAALLAASGGVYLDLDTITVASLRPLLSVPAFIGVERIVRPHFVHASRSGLLRGWSTALSSVRNAFRVCPDGYRIFPLVEPLYYRAVNGAILGTAPGHPLVVGYLKRMVDLPFEAANKKHGLGTHLLQKTIDAYEEDDLVTHPPEVFYPMAPEISEHWFRKTRPVLSRVVRPNTRVVHWYASGRTKTEFPKVDPAYVRAHADRQLYSALVAPILPEG